MAAIANLTTLNALLKTLYPQSDITKMFYENAPFLAMVPKAKDFKGNVAQIALRYSTTQGRSQDFATAQNNATAAAYAKWLLTRAHDYSIFNIDNETLLAAKDKGAIVEGLETEVDAAMDAIKRALQIDLYGNAGGSRGYGNGAWVVTGTVITLGRIQDIVNFEANMVLQAATTDGTSGAIKKGTVTVLGVDRDLGTITLTAAANAGIATIANTDFLFQAGDFLSAKSKIMGLGGWIPATAPITGDNFFGLDRSVDPYRLAGVRFTANNSLAGQAIEESLQRAATRIAREGGRPTHAFLNNDDYLALQLSLGSRLAYTEATTDVGVGFKGIEVAAGSVMLKCFADPNCPQGTCFVLQLDTWKLWSLGECPMFLGEAGDGLRMLRNPTTDSFQGRIGYYAQLYCTAPGYNGRIATP